MKKVGDQNPHAKAQGSGPTDKAPVVMNYGDTVNEYTPVYLRDSHDETDDECAEQKWPQLHDHTS